MIITLLLCLMFVHHFTDQAFVMFDVVYFGVAATHTLGRIVSGCTQGHVI